MLELSRIYKLTGEHEKALLLADSAPDIEASKPFLRINAFDGKGAVAASGETLVWTVYCLTDLIAAIVRADRSLPPKTAAELIANDLMIFDLVFTDGDYGKLCGTIAVLHILRSYYLWLAGEKDGAFAALDMALELSRRFDGESSKAAYSSLLLRYAAPLECSFGRVLTTQLPQLWPWWDVPEAERVKNEMRMDERWAAWEQKALAEQGE